MWSSPVLVYPYNSQCSRVGEMHCKASSDPVSQLVKTQSSIFLRELEGFLDFDLGFKTTESPIVPYFQERGPFFVILNPKLVKTQSPMFWGELWGEGGSYILTLGPKLLKIPVPYFQERGRFLDCNPESINPKVPSFLYWGSCSNDLHHFLTQSPMYRGSHLQHCMVHLAELARTIIKEFCFLQGKQFTITDASVN